MLQVGSGVAAHVLPLEVWFLAGRTRSRAGMAPERQGPPSRPGASSPSTHTKSARVRRRACAGCRRACRKREPKALWAEREMAPGHFPEAALAVEGNTSVRETGTRLSARQSGKTVGFGRGLLRGITHGGLSPRPAVLPGQPCCAWPFLSLCLPFFLSPSKLLKPRAPEAHSAPS